MYVCMYVCIYIYICIHVYVYMCICVCIYIYIYIDTRAYICIAALAQDRSIPSPARALRRAVRPRACSIVVYHIISYQIRYHIMA